jgi:Methyltransferase domain
MKTTSTPVPDVMPVDRIAWSKELHLSNFVNTYYQYRDLQLCRDVKHILIIGPGQGLDTQVLRWRRYKITTFDIDSTFRPDVLGSVHDMRMFTAKQFDAVIASHVLEHLALPYLDTSLQEIARISRYALIYLPLSGRHFQLRLKGDVKGFDTSFFFDLFNYFHKPDGVTARYCQQQHFWEVGMRGFRVKDLNRRFSVFFKLLRTYRNRDWYSSQNFVLESKSIL